MFNVRKNITVQSLNLLLNNSMASHLGMEVHEIGEDYLVLKMPVDHRTMQTYGVLNGGASMALVETAGSLAANCILDEDKICVGLSINGNHLRPVSSGFVYGTAKPIHTGKSTHVWEVKITDDNNKLINISRLTLAIINKNK